MQSWYTDDLNRLVMRKTVIVKSAPATEESVMFSLSIIIMLLSLN